MADYSAFESDQLTLENTTKRLHGYSGIRPNVNRSGS